MFKKWLNLFKNKRKFRFAEILKIKLLNWDKQTSSRGPMEVE